MRILLIEDGHWDAGAIAHRLDSLGLWALRVKTIPEAIEKIESGLTFAGVITDVFECENNALTFIDWVNDHWEDHPPILVHGVNDMFEDFDLNSLNFHTSNKVTFAKKALVMRGDNNKNYRYLEKFVDTLTLA